MSDLTSRLFWQNVAERALKTFAQVAAATLTADSVSAFDVDWQGVLAISFTGAVYSVLTSIASAKLTGENDPSLVAGTNRHM